VPLTKPGNLSGLGAEVSLNEAHIALGYLVGKRADAPQGARVTIHVRGPTTRDLHVVVDGRAQVLADLNDPTVEVTVDFATFMLLCCGRIDPTGPLADGTVTISRRHSTRPRNRHQPRSHHMNHLTGSGLSGWSS
jgi:hypothetical protein